MGRHLHLYLYLFLYLFFPFPLSAQVTIRDTIRISSVPAVAPSSLPSSTIRLVLTHNGSVDMSGTVSRVLTIRNRFCGDNMTAQINGPVTEVLIPARGAAVEAINAFRVRQSPDFHRSYAFYLDDELVDSMHFVSQCPVSCLFTGHVQTVPLYSSFTLGVNDPFHPFDLDHGETAQQFTLKYSAASCGTTVWHPNCATTVRITQGAELGTLIGPDGADLGDEFTGTAEEIKQLQFSANGIQPADEVAEAVVEVSSRGLASFVTFRVRRTVVPIHHFTIIADPDSIRHGSIADIFVTAKDAENQDIALPPDTPVDFFLGAGNGDFGDLAATIHGTPVKGDQLPGVRYDQAKAGGVIYIADGKNPVGLNPPEVPIGVQLQGQPGVSGFATVTVGCRLDPPRYAQGDARWGNDHYDNAFAVKNADTTNVGIGTLGCALSCMAMAMTAFGDTVDPGELNGFKKSDSTLSSYKFQGRSVSWKAIEGFSSARVRTTIPIDTDSTFALTALDQFFTKCELVIARVFNPRSVQKKSASEKKAAETLGNHWVLIKRKEGMEYEIADPGRGLSKLSEYGRIYRFVRIQKS